MPCYFKDNYIIIGGQTIKKLSNLKTPPSRSRRRSNSGAAEMAIKGTARSVSADLIRRAWSDISGWEGRYPIINRRMKVSPEDHVPFQEKRQRGLTPMTGPNNLREAEKTNELPMTVLGSYKRLPIHLPLVVCVCMVFNECFTYQDSSITNEGRTVLCYCSRMPDTKLCMLLYIENCSTSTQKNAWFLDNVCWAH